MRVLVVDDHAINRKLLRVMLGSGGHETVEAADGVEALEHLQGGGFDAVISDVFMPRMDGYRLTHEIRRSAELRHLPLIIYSSTYLSDSDQGLALSAGADLFLRKPAAAEVILSALTRLAARPRPKIAPPQAPLGSLKEYSENLVRMLEERNRELEATRQRLASTNKALRESEESFRRVFLANPIASCLTEIATGRFLDVNDRLIQVLGFSREELLGRTSIELGIWVDPAERERMVAAIAASIPFREQEVRLRTKSGEILQVLDSVEPVQVGNERVLLSAFQDVTEQRKLEEQFRKAQKMEAVGTLTSGIAHDFNNLLTPILGYSDLLARDLAARGEYHQAIHEIRRAGESAAKMTRQLLAFSRQQVLSLEVIDLNANVQDMEEMLRRLIGEDLELRAVLAPNLGRVKADRGQIDQVIMNLVVNARDAMPAGGRLTIETRNVELDDDYAREHVSVLPGPYAMLSVSDTGAGMDEATQSRIFEPFFTTKEPGKGTGLGLSTIYGIIKQSGGNIWVYSEPGHGSTFKIYLPRVEEPLAPAARSGPADLTAARLEGNETILVAEDDDAVRLVTRLVLERYGYTVLATSCGFEAMEIARSHSGPIHAVVTDVLMSGISGPELAAQIVALLPNVKVLLMSGYSESAVSGHLGAATQLALLEKPFTADALARKLRQVLDG
jgi:two-component system, cell cycle sensor histidine kinase and response regulator CckA